MVLYELGFSPDSACTEPVEVPDLQGACTEPVEASEKYRDDPSGRLYKFRLFIVNP